ncbi:MAG TPA: DNA-binding protein, partial [Rikenellaceae bacterium]|nr:DNA-binding protein [Rikenellaceae bacterium]
MKIKKIIAALLATMTLAIGCESEQEYLDEIRVSSSYVAIPAEGGSQTITVRARYAWSLENIPEWLEVTPDSGFDGETEVTFKAKPATATQSAELQLNCKNDSQVINVLQMTEKVDLPLTSLKKFLEAEVGPTTYRIAGTITSIEEISASYKNATLTISDEEGNSVYLYRFGPSSGKKIEELGMEVGDFLTVEGQRGEYKGSPQMAQGGVFISLVKSLIKVDSVTVKIAGSEEFKLYSEPIPLEGADVKAHLTVKGSGLSVVVPDAAKSWISVNAIETSGNNSIVSFSVAANAYGDRTADLTFNTVSGGKTNTAQTSLEQKGAIIETTIDKLLAAEDGATQYRTTGYITNDKGSEYGNIYIKDATGEIYVYGVLDSKGQTKQWKNMGIKEGDIVTVVGPKTSHKGTAQLQNVTVENHIKVQDISLADFRALKDDKT